MRKIGDLNPAKRPEVREKIRESMIKAFSERPEMVERMRLQRSNQVFPLKDTKIEVKIQNYLKEIGLEFFTHQYIGDIKNSYQCDILVPSLGLVIECDGDYWHQYPIGRDIDCIRTSELLAKGFKVLRLWEHEIKKLTLEEFKQKIDVQVGV